MPTKIVLLATVLFALSCQTPHTPNEKRQDEPAVIKNPYTVDSNRMAAAKLYCAQNGFNESYALFSDMSIRSGKKRFFVVDFNKDSVVDAGLVAHGHCQSYASRKPSFSNEVGSNCTSLGRYKIGYKYDGNYGLAYKLYGMDETNSNAFDRYVVLHGHSCVPESETIVGICRSEGCPTLSPAFLDRLSVRLDASTLPVLLWVYN